MQFGLKDLTELPSLKEFQEIVRFDTESSGAEPAPDADTAAPDGKEPIEMPRKDQHQDNPLPDESDPASSGQAE